MSNIIDVQITHEQQYSINVGTDLKKLFTAFCEARYSGRQIFVMIDEKVSAFHRDTVEQMCRSVFANVYFLEIPQGEVSKSISYWNKSIDKVLEIGVERSTPLLAVGGGVTGDLGGFVAASVLRGIPLIHMPTSLLAMVDSSIGGKTGINHTTGKNLIGAFYQPTAVFCDIRFLETLENKEWITGMAEILKYAAIADPALFEDLEMLASQPLHPNEDWEKVIRQSARIKTEVVQEDALEAGKRAYLNFGHTFGHALEKVAGYGNISHGEAVFVGMIAATYFSAQLGHPVDDQRFKPFVSLYRQQMSPLPIDIEDLIKAMQSDKKVKNKILRLVLLNQWGSPYIYKCTDHSKLYDAWKYALAQFN